MSTLLNEIKHSWNVFNGTTNFRKNSYVDGGNYTNPTRIRFSRGNERTIITSVYNRMALDVGSIDIKHVKTDKDGRYSDDVNSGLNKCLSLQANIDQSGTAFIQDIVCSMFDEGCVAVVPVEVDINQNGVEILSLRTAKIIEWFPDKVGLNIYNEKNGRRENITLPKSRVAIIENPYYAIMNEPNSTMQRLIKKLSMMDSVDEANCSGNLDLIVKLPYAVKTETRKQQAQQRREEIQDQLYNSKYGIAYVDATEEITQLNRPVENNLMKQIEYLTDQLYRQLGITNGILDGTADANTMNNYFARIIEPIVNAIVSEFDRTFISESKRENLEKIMYFRDPFKLIPVTEAVNVADTYTRNEVLSSNEVRDIIGRKPSKDPNADQLRNKNLSQSKEVLREQMKSKNQNDANNKEEV